MSAALWGFEMLEFIKKLGAGSRKQVAKSKEKLPALERSNGAFFLSDEGLKLFMSWANRTAVIILAAFYLLLAVVIWDPGGKFSGCYLPLLFGAANSCISLPKQ